MVDPNKRKPHIFLGKNGKREPYTYGGPGPRDSTIIPPHNRQQHGQALQNQLQTVATEQDQLVQEAEDYDLELPMGIQVEFESFPGVELAVASLADSRQGNVSGKYSYPSHQLRFDVKRPLESLDAFRKRINRQARDEEEGTNSAPQDSNWVLGSQFRHKGSIHRDTWTGSAADLAERGQVVVYPATGWWRTRTRLQRSDKQACYALIVSISVPDADVDIYSEVENAIAIQQAT